MPRLIPVIKRSRRLHGPESLAAIRDRAAAPLAKLAGHLAVLETANVAYPVKIHPVLRKLANQADRVMSEVPVLCR